MKTAILAAILAIFTIAAAQPMKQPQETLDSWARAHYDTLATGDTIFANTVWIDTVNIGANLCYPDHFAIWIQVDTMTTTGDQPACTLKTAFEVALNYTGPYKEIPIITRDITPEINDVGTFLLPISFSPTGDFMRIEITATDTLIITAILWMRR